MPAGTVHVSLKCAPCKQPTEAARGCCWVGTAYGGLHSSAACAYRAAMERCLMTVPKVAAREEGGHTGAPLLRAARARGATGGPAPRGPPRCTRLPGTERSDAPACSASPAQCAGAAMPCCPPARGNAQSSLDNMCAMCECAGNMTSGIHIYNLAILSTHFLDRKAFYAFH